ncbi:ABC transporter substrate-binding protein [Psychromicrobium lacuslunae]|uniref:ABC transporter substrate-binding protein n=1 Tax=Psychromicrobium lacuslunae TaxID=1618207 RepID=A0A0D4BW49_9MICC|nr:ABC transporter substrate-binding protein [Psychromicrobium lacuslunae]AJT40682.1 ABC transporter substrate-binding protein [Psychromicrobium lacuslunae]
MKSIKSTASVTAALLAGVLLLSGCGADTEPAETGGESADLSKLKDDFYPATDPSKSPAAANSRPDSFVTTISKPGGVFLPGFYDNGWDGNAVQPIFASLVVADHSGKPTPDLAEKWEISSDNLSYTFHLRDGLSFSDGSALTADDVAFTLTLLNDSSYAGGVDFSKIVIDGTDEYRKGTASSLKGIQVIDPKTIKITTKKPNPLALTTLGGPVISKAYYGKGYSKGHLDYLKELYGKPLGAGPYGLEKYVEGQEIRYTANEHYYAGKPAIKTLIFKVLGSDTALQNFQNGDIDQGGFGSDPATLDKLKGLGFANVRSRVISDFGAIWVNNEKPALADTKVRQALYYGLDRQQIVDAKFKGLGQVADVLAAPPLWSYTTTGVTHYGYDPQKAGELLDQAGWKAGANGIREKDGKKLSLSYITTKQDDPVIPIAKQSYQSVGIDFVPEVLDSNTAFERLNKGDYDLAGFRSNGLGDPDDAVSEFGSDDPSVNLSHYKNPEVKALIAKGTSTFDQAERQKVYTELYQKLSQDPPIILLDYRKSLSAWNARIENGELYSTGDSDAALSLAKLKIAAK